MLLEWPVGCEVNGSDCYSLFFLCAKGWEHCSDGGREGETAQYAKCPAVCKTAISALQWLQSSVAPSRRLVEQAPKGTNHMQLFYVAYIIGTPKIYTTTGFGSRKNREMAGVDDLVVYKRPRGGVYTNCCILQQFAYTPPNRPHQPFPYFF